MLQGSDNTQSGNTQPGNKQPGDTKGSDKIAVEFNDLTKTSGEWLRGNGPEADIVISSRIRLARNLAEFPFISRATPQDRVQIERILHDSVIGSKISSDLLYIAVDELEGVDRQLLVERHLISRELAEGQ